MTAPEFVRCEAGHVTLAGASVCRSCHKGTRGTLLTSAKYRAPQDYRWRDKAACREMPPEMFQPRDEVTAKRAQHVCLTECPVMAQCALEAKAQGRFIVGVWAGKWYREPVPKPPKTELREAQR